MRRPENSPGSPAQWPAVSTSFGAMMVPEQRNAGLPAMSIMMRTTAGWAFPSSVPSVMKDGRPGLHYRRHARWESPSRRRPNHYGRSEEHTSELQSPDHLVCRLLLEKKKK